MYKLWLLPPSTLEKMGEAGEIQLHIAGPFSLPVCLETTRLFEQLVLRSQVDSMCRYPRPRGC
jgi:hypothetical protein